MSGFYASNPETYMAGIETSLICTEEIMRVLCESHPVFIGNAPIIPNLQRGLDVLDNR